MTKLKVRKIGNSLGVILPVEELKRLNVGEGDELHVVETKDGVELTAYDPDFDEAMAVFEEGRKNYRNALRRLAK